MWFRFEALHVLRRQFPQSMVTQEYRRFFIAKKEKLITKAPLRKDKYIYLI